MGLSSVVKLARKAIRVGSCGAVIVAAGSASRMGGVDKVMADIGGEPMILRTVRAFAEAEVIREIVIVTREDLIRPVTALCGKTDKVRAVVAGGKTRQESVHLGMNALSPQVKLVAVHDGARPFASQALIDRMVRAGHSFGAAVPAVPLKDTVKTKKNGIVGQTPDRSSLCAVQTPQVFDFDLLRGALAKAEADGAEITDDASAVERMGMTVKIMEGEEQNIKITTPMDLKLAQLIWEDMV